jgi:eukaryotic-like serine/threonine-protein kinase
MKNNIVEFIRQKDYRFVKEIGQGGTGRTVLLLDEAIGESFVCKKYSPNDPTDKELYFQNFVDEIKILYKLSHRNVVRVFNYYLYPEIKTGYILMEYIEGQNISDYLKSKPDRLADIFVQAISGFTHLENNNILHRDIRPENFIISADGVLKIIDFGFGKKVNIDLDFDKSISLNWRYAPPNEFKDKIYDFKTEIYFVGKLFQEIIRDKAFKDFSFSKILTEMVKVDYKERISSFSIIDRKITTKSAINTFKSKDKLVYQAFADELLPVFKSIVKNAEYIIDIDKILMDLDKLYRNSSLEIYVQNMNSVTNCFIRGDYRYYPSKKMLVSTLLGFVNLLKSVSSENRRIVLNNLWNRLDTVDRYSIEPSDELPF